MADGHESSSADADDPSGRPLCALPMPDDMANNKAVDEVANESATDCDQDMIRTRGIIWIHFKRIPDREGRKMAKCRYCGNEYACSNHSTGNLWR
jgi:hypothetical protein